MRLLSLLMPWRRRAAAAGGRTAQRMTEREFLHKLGIVLEQQGFQVVDASRSRWVDLVVRKQRETYLVMAREWQSPKVEPEPVRALYDAMVARNVAGGIAVTTGRFSRRAQTFAAANNIRLMDGEVLKPLLAAVDARPR